MAAPRKTTRKKKRRQKNGPLLKTGVGMLVVFLIVALSAAATSLLPKQEGAPYAAAAAPTQEPTPSPEPTISPTPALYAPFGAQYGHGGAELIPETPTPKPTAAPTPSPTPKPTEPPADELPVVEASYTTLRKGSIGPSVKALQQALIDLGYLSDKADGNFGSNTQAAVVQFQAVNGLAADGLAGSQTQTLLFSGNALPASKAPEMDFVMLVNRENKLDKHFAPTNLVKIEDVIPSDVLKVKYKGTKADRTATEALYRMLEDAIADGITVWQVSSAYRTHSEQQALVDQSVNNYKKNNPSWSKERCLSATYQTVAPAGTSEHQTGLAFDITVPGVSFTGTEQQKWLHEHCYEYGFVVRFTEDKQSKTGFLAESWHFRYVGVEAARVMTFNNWCLEEYIDIMGP